MLKVVFLVSACWFAFCGWVVWFCSKRHDTTEQPTTEQPTTEQIEQAEGEIDKIRDVLNSARDEADNLRRELRAAQWQADRYKHLLQKTSRLANSQRAKINEYKRQIKDFRNDERQQTT